MNPDHPATYEDILAINAPDAAEEIPQSPQDTTEDAPEVSFGEWFAAVARRDFTPYGLARYAVDDAIPWDENFDFETQVPKEEWEELSDGLPENVLSNIADRARSRGHLYYLFDIARESLVLEETINAPGAVTGTLGRIAASVVDPGNLALAVTTGGAGLVGRAERLQRAVGRASTLAERRALVAELGETVAQTGVARQAASRAAAAGAESAAVSAVVNAGDPTKDEWDTVYGTVGGLALGGIIGGALSAREASRLRSMLSVETRRLENAEAADAVAKQRGTLAESVGDIAAARTRVAQSHEEAGAFLAERDSDLSTYGAFRRALESGGKADAANPNSSALGADQFIASTWLRTVEQSKPEWANGLSKSELLALRTDPAKSAEMVAFLDEQNAAVLRKADAPVNHFNLYAMHHFGPASGKRFALAASDAKAEDLFSAKVLEANPYLRGKTKAQIVANWTQRASRSGIDLDDMLDRAPASKAEASRLAELRSIDREGTSAVLAELDTEVQAFRAKRAKVEQEAAETILTKTTSGTPTPTPTPRAVAARKTLDALLRDDPTPRITAEASQLRAALGIAEGLQRQVEVDVARRATVRGSRRAVRDTEAQITQLETLDALAGNLDARQLELDTRGNAAPVDRETLSAARVSGFDAGLYPSLEDRAGEFRGIGQMKFGAAAGLYGRGTFSGVLRGSDNETVRNLLGPMVSNVLGNLDGSAVSVGADEIVSGVSRAAKGRFDAAVFNPYREWLREQGVTRLRAFNRDVRSRFMRELRQAIRNPDATASPAVQQAADQVRGIFADILKQAKDAGVSGFENVTENANWLPRVFDFHALHGLNQRFGPEQIEALIKGAILQAAPELEDGIAARVASAYFKRMRELRMGNDAGLMQGMSLDNVPFMRRFLEDAGLLPDEVNGMLDKFRALNLSNGPKGGGDFRHAKRRLQLDETFSMRLRRKGTVSDAPENFEEVTVSDLFDSNVENLFGRYSRTMAGHIGLAKAGIKGRADFEERLRIVAHELEGDPEQWKAVEMRARAAYDLLTARPIEDASLWTELTRTARDLAFDTQMENAGLSNVPDMAALLAWGNFRHTAAAFFRGDVFGAVWKRGRDGRLSDELFREIEETFGLGTDFLNNQVFSAYDLGEEYVEEAASGRRIPKALAQGFAKVGHGARVVGRGVSAGSGLAAVQSFTQRIAARNVIFRIKEEVFAGKGFSKARMAALGIDEATGKRIEAQMRKHTVWVEGDVGGRVQYVNFQAWDDLDARDAFMYGVMRETKKNAQESTLGDTFLFQHKTIGKVLSQFRAFGLAAYTKQLLRGLSEADAEAATRAAMQFMLAAGVWKLRHEAVAYGMEAAGAEPDKVEEYREANLTPGRIAAAGIRNSGTFALAPDISDTLTGLVGVRVFDVRNSGLSSSALDLNSTPALAFGNKLAQAVSGTAQAAIRDDRQFTQRELRAWQSVIPFGHHLLVAPAFEAVSANLPKQNDDPNPEEIDWL